MVVDDGYPQPHHQKSLMTGAVTANSQLLFVQTRDRKRGEPKLAGQARS